MPQIPRIENQASPTRSSPVQAYQPPRTNAAFELGAGLSNVASIVSAIQDRERATGNPPAVTGAHTKMTSWVNGALYTGSDAALSKKGKDTFGLSNVVLPKYQAAVNELAKDMKNRSQQRAFSEIALDFQGQIER